MIYDRKPEDLRVVVLQLGFVHDATELKCKAEIFSRNSSHEHTQILQCHYSCSEKPVWSPLFQPPNWSRALVSNLIGSLNPASDWETGVLSGRVNTQ